MSELEKIKTELEQLTNRVNIFQKQEAAYASFSKEELLVYTHHIVRKYLIDVKEQIKRMEITDEFVGLELNDSRFSGRKQSQYELELVIDSYGITQSIADDLEMIVDSENVESLMTDTLTTINNK